ncbi:hypothetical protein [uncultured Lamprocystis sp.]|nr:hypothetical protein [uncultured Lamprocystis sp.]
MDKRSASTIGLAADTLLAAATQIWNCCGAFRIVARLGHIAYIIRC